MRNNKGMRDPLYTSRKNGRGLHVKYSLQPYLKFKSDIFRTHLTPRVSEIRVWNKSAKKAAPITLHLVVCHSAACKMVRKFIVMHRLRIQDRGRGLRFDIRINGEYSRKYRDMEIESFGIESSHQKPYEYRNFNSETCSTLGSFDREIARKIRFAR